MLVCEEMYRCKMRINHHRDAENVQRERETERQRETETETQEHNVRFVDEHTLS